VFSKSKTGHTLDITVSKGRLGVGWMNARFVRRPDGTIELTVSPRTVKMLVWLGYCTILMSIGKPIVRELRWRAMMRRDLEALNTAYSHTTKSQSKGESRLDRANVGGIERGDWEL
jgi:hypothetical protein